MKRGGNLAYDVFVNEPPAQDGCARALYGVREHPGENPAQLALASWLD